MPSAAFWTSRCNKCRRTHCPPSPDTWFYLLYGEAINASLLVLDTPICATWGHHLTLSLAVVCSSSLPKQISALFCYFFFCLIMSVMTPQQPDASLPLVPRPTPPRPVRRLSERCLWPTFPRKALASIKTLFYCFCPPPCPPRVLFCC